MADSAARLLALLSLLQTPRQWPGSELAERLGVTDRTVRRDVDRLRGLGYPIEATLGTLGGYRLAAGQAMPPLLLDDEEAIAIAVGVRAAAGMAVEGLGEASARALAKLSQVLPSRLQRRVRVLAAATVPATGDGPQVDAEVLTSLAVAIARMEKIRFGYRSGDGTKSRRLADPVGLVVHRRHWYLVGFDDARQAWRTYRVDRASAPHRTGVRATPPDLPAANPADYVAGFRSDWATPVHRLEVTFDAPVRAVSGRLGDGPGEVRPLDGDRCRLLAERDDSLPWLAERMLALGCDFEIHAPFELAEILAEYGDRALRSVRNAGGQGR